MWGCGHSLFEIKLFLLYIKAIFGKGSYSIFFFAFSISFLWDVAIPINWSDWPVSLARRYTKVIIKLKV